MLDIDELPIASDEDLFVKVMQSQDYDTLLRAARMLPAPYREVLLIICVEGQTVVSRGQCASSSIAGKNS